MATYTTELVVGDREDLSDIIYNIAPTDTPFMMLAGRGTASNVTHEWQTDSLAAPASNAQAEGDDLGFASERKRMEERNVRVVFDTALDDIATLHLPPRDVGGAILSIDRAIPWESWRWAGPDWNQRIRKTRVGSLLGAGIQARNPDAMAQRWSDVLGQSVLSFPSQKI